MSHRGVFGIPDHVLARRVGDDLVLLNLASGTYYGMESAGARVWDLMGEGKTLDEINTIMLGEYEVGADVLREDIEEIVQDLELNGLVTAK